MSSLSSFPKQSSGLTSPSVDRNYYATNTTKRMRLSHAVTSSETHHDPRMDDSYESSEHDEISASLLANTFTLIDSPAYAVDLLQSLPERFIRSLNADRNLENKFSRITNDGWVISFVNTTFYLWNVVESENLNAVIQLTIPTHLIGSTKYSNPTERLFVLQDPESPEVAFVYVTDTGTILYSSNPHQSFESICNFTLSKEEICTCTSLISIGTQFFIVISTDSGRLIGVTLSESLSSPRLTIIDPSRTRGSMLTGIGRMLRLSAASPQPDSVGSPIISLKLHSNSENNFCNFVLTEDSLTMWRFTPQYQHLQWSSNLPEIGASRLIRNRTCTFLTMTNTSSELLILLSISSDDHSNKAEYFLAVLSVDIDKPIPVQLTQVVAVPLVSHHNVAPIHMVATEDRSLQVYVYTSTHLVVIKPSANVENDSSCFSARLRTQCLLGSGVLPVSQFTDRVGSTSAYFVTDGYGIIQINLKSGIMHSWQAHFSAGSGTVEEKEIQIDNQGASIFRCAFHLFERQRQSAAERILLLGSRKQLVPPTTHPTSTLITSAEYSSFDQVCMAFVHELTNQQKSRSFSASNASYEAEDDEGTLLNSAFDRKSVRFTTYLKFLCSCNYWTNLSYNAQQSILHHGEMLSSLQSLYLTWTQDLRKQQDEQGALYLQERYKWIRKLFPLILNENSGFAASAIFEMTSVASAPKVVEAIRRILNEEYLILATDPVELKQKKLVVIHASSVALANVFSATFESHNECIALLRNAGINNIPIPLWTFDAHLREEIKGICRFITSSILSIPKSKNFSAIGTDLFHYVFHICRDYLRMYSDILGESNSTIQSSGIMLRLYDQEQSKFASDRSELISLLRQALPCIPNASTDVLYQVAAQFRAYQELLELCDSENSDSNRKAKIEQYLSQFGLPFAKVLLEVYFDQMKISQLLSVSQPFEYQDWLANFVSNKPEYRWLVDWQQKKYKSAAETLSHIAFNDSIASRMNLTATDKKTLMSMSKLSYLAAGKSPQDSEVQSITKAISAVTT